MCEDEVRRAIVNFIEENENNLRDKTTYGRGYAEGYQDALVDVLNELGISNDYGYFN